MSKITNSAKTKAPAKTDTKTSTAKTSQAKSAPKTSQAKAAPKDAAPKDAAKISGDAKTADKPNAVPDFHQAFDATKPADSSKATLPAREEHPVGKGDLAGKRGVNFSKLISDKEFTDTKSVSRDDIQKFLESKGGPLGGLKDADGRSAADIISQASEKHGVSPMVILSTLQKEQSLVTKDGNTDARLAKAMGYGHTDKGKVAGAYSSFANQVDNGTRTLAGLYNAAPDSQKMKVDDGKTNLQINNKATGALYEYTPHTGEGNQLFHDTYSKFVEDMRAIQNR